MKINFNKGDIRELLVTRTHSMYNRGLSILEPRGEEKEIFERIKINDFVVDSRNDVQVHMEDGSKIWLTTNPTIHEINRAGDYEIELEVWLCGTAKYDKKYKLFNLR